MAVNPEVEGVVSSGLNRDAAEADQPVPAPAKAPETPPHTGYGSIAPVADQASAQLAAPAIPASAAPAFVAPDVARAPEKVRSHRGWLGTVAVGCVGVIAAGALGYFLYSTAHERDGALGQVATTQARLTSTEDALAGAQQDLIARKAIGAYTTTYLADSGRIRIDYQTLVACTKFGTCRTAAQSLLTDLQGFQSDRSNAGVPAALANSNAMLRDALSAAIAADQELISGMDNGNENKFRDGFRKLNAAMLAVAKAEAALGAELR